MDINLFLQKIGLDEDEIAIYTSLLKLGNATVVKISKNIKINRSKIYRRLENLKKLKLIEEIIDNHTTRYKVSDPDQLELLVLEQQQQFDLLANKLPLIKQQIFNKINNQDPETLIKFYRGKSGIKQMIWKILKAKDHQVVGYTYRQLSEITGESFARRWAEEFSKNNMHFRDIYSDKYLQSKTSNHRDPSEFVDKVFFKSRYLSQEILDIDFQTDIYDNCVNFYNWHQGEVFGIEIINPKIAKFQKQIFEILWQKAKIKPTDRD